MRTATSRLPTGIDVEARDRWFAQAVGASPEMFLRTAGAGSLYWLGLRDKDGAYLDGGKTYKLSVPQPVPQKLFWSVTVYDSGTRSQSRRKDKAALRSLVELKDASKTGTIDLYFGPNVPAGQERQWIKTDSRQGLVRLSPPVRAGRTGLRWQLEAGRLRRGEVN